MMIERRRRSAACRGRKRTGDRAGLLGVLEGADHLQIAQRGRVQEHVIALLVHGDPVDVREGNSNLKKEFMKRTKFHMVHTTFKPKSGANYYERHLKDEAPNSCHEVFPKPRSTPGKP